MKNKYESLDEYIADLKSEISQNEQCANHHYNLGLALLSKRDFVGAEDCFLAALRNSPRLAEAFVQLGGICLERGDLDGCLRYNEEASNCRAKFPVPWSNIGFVYIQQGEPEKAIKALKKAIKWDPNFIQAHNALATAYFMLEDYESSVKSCNEVLKRAASFAPAWNNLALAFFEQGKFAEAIDAVDKAVAGGFEVREEFLADLAPHRK